MSCSKCGSEAHPDDWHHGVVSTYDEEAHDSLQSQVDSLRIELSQCEATTVARIAAWLRETGAEYSNLGSDVICNNLARHVESGDWRLPPRQA